MATITLEKVWKKYGTVEAVKGIDLTFRDGQFHSILGPSGCGKTSTLRMIAGLEEITAGKISFDGRVINELTPSQRDLAMAFEDYALYPALSVFENIAFPLRAPHRAMHYDADQIQTKVQETAAMLDLTPILHHPVKRLSGGQQQRVSLARALIRPASVYLLDEPLSHLDSRQRVELRANLKRMQQLDKKTFMLVTHDQSEAMAMADQIVVMHLGEIQQVGTPWEIFNKPANLFVADFIGDPPMNFMDARLDADRGKLICSGFEIDLPDRMKGKGSKDPEMDRLFKLGVRPNHLEVAKKEQPGFPIFGEVYVLEHLGDEVIVTVSCNAFRIKALLPNDFTASVGEKLWLKPNPEFLNVFHV